MEPQTLFKDAIVLKIFYHTILLLAIIKIKKIFADAANSLNFLKRVKTGSFLCGIGIPG